MTYAPADLLAVQRYAREKTGQGWVALGIVGDQSHNSSGGYHVGVDVLRKLGTAPEQPGGDYSYTESSRDRAGMTAAASAFDLGGGFPRFYAFNAWVVGRARAKDPRCRDIREVIYTPDGSIVRRWDALGIRSSGDSSHLTHTHFSFFRDSEGRRDRADNFLGLLREFFDGPRGDDIVTQDDINKIAAAVWGKILTNGKRISYPAEAWLMGGNEAAWGALEKASSPAAPSPATLTAADRTAIAEQVKAGLLADLAPLIDLARKIGNG